MINKILILLMFALCGPTYGADFITKTVSWTVNADGVTVKSWARVIGKGFLLVNFAIAYGIDMNVTGFSHKYQVSEKKHGEILLSIHDVKETIITEFNLSSWKPGEKRNLQTQIKFSIKDGALTFTGLGFQISLGSGEDASTENYNGIELTKPCPEP